MENHYFSFLPLDIYKFLSYVWCVLILSFCDSILTIRLTFSVTGTALFDSGFASLNSQGRPIMDGITQIIQEFVEFNVNIKGHTDNIPISTNKFPSNWELSAVRSTTVLRYLLEKGVNAERLTATGYADLLPLGPNNTDEDRQKNRRVEFVLEKEDE